jgi:transaldolase
MTNNYFQKLKELTQTRMWVNNPTVAEVDLALAHGAAGCTTNPAFSAKILQREPDTVRKVADQCIAESGDDAVAADLVQQKLAIPVLKRFMPLYESTGGRQGWVSLQGNPYSDGNAEEIIEESRRYRRLMPNVIAKIPATKAGLEALETLIAEDVPVIFTEAFALSQMIHAGELYNKAARRSGKRPTCFVTHITGIFDDHLKDFVKHERIAIAPAVLEQAGLAVARKQYRLFKQRGYEGLMLGGGGRATYHFTGLVGGDMHITINWSTAQEILEQDPPVSNTLAATTPPEVVDELLEKIPDFRRAWLEDGLTLEDFSGYGPVQRFRNQFLAGWDTLLMTVTERRRLRTYFDNMSLTVSHI